MVEQKEMDAALDKLRAEFSQQLQEVKDIMLRPPHVVEMLNFIQKMRVTNKYELSQELKKPMAGSTLSRLHDALKTTAGFKFLAGTNRFVSNLYIYDNGKYFNDGHPLTRLILFKFYEKAAPTSKRDINSKTRMTPTPVDAKHIDIWVTEQTGDGDLAKATVQAIWQDKALREVMKGRVVWSQVGKAFWRVA